MQGKIIKSTGLQYIVMNSNGLRYNCMLKGGFRNDNIKSTNPLVVGDIVEFEERSKLFVIIRILKRKNYIKRKSVNLSKKIHIIAANIDQAILMITLDHPVTTLLFIDRFLVEAKASSIDVILLFNKIDLFNERLKLRQNEIINLYENIGYMCFSFSVLNDDLSSLKDAMKDKINLIAGHSGVGKSTLVNKLDSKLNIKTSSISDAHNQGQHTTTFSELHLLDFGASIIDTPGIKGFGLIEIEKKDIREYFAEFILFQNKCKYKNCMHKNEPDCNVKKQIGTSISQNRYLNYLSIIDECDEQYRNNNY